MTTIKDVLNQISERFESNDLCYAHGTTNAWDEAVFLVFSCLHLPLNSNTSVLSKPVAKKQLDHINQLATIRITEHKPMAYLLNNAIFAGLEFYVNEHVLIPRSPFAEIILAGFQPWLGTLSPKRILEIGTGSGCIAIATALLFPDAQVDAVDISPSALAVAKRNIAQYHLSNRIQLIESDMFNNISHKYDLILSNPPYVDQQDMDERPAEFHHEPNLALESGHDGLDHTRTILQHASHHLTDSGMLLVEVGNSAPALEAAYPQTPFTWIELTHGGHGIFCLNKTEIPTH